MQDLQGLVINDFEKSATIVLGKAEIDIDGTGNFVELQDVKSFNIQSNITNIFQNTCAISFNINLLNNKDRYSFYDKGASCYGYIKEGRNVRLYLGARLKPAGGFISENTNILGDTDDGFLDGEGEIYTEVRNLEIATYINDYDEFLPIGQNYYELWYFIARSCLYFDTSVIPSNAIITKATLKIYNLEKYSDTDFNIMIQNGMPDHPNKPLQESDYNKNHYSGNGGSINTAGWLEGEFREIEFTEQGRVWINKGGITKLILRSDRDINGIEPTSSEYIIISSQEYIEESQRPILYIEYEVPGGVTVFDDYYWSWIYGIIDKADMQYSESGEICNISGRDYIAYLSETYLKKVWWGKNKKYDIVADQEHYIMEEDCKGIYRAFLDDSGTGFREIWLNSEWTYDWDINEFVFLKPNVPKVSGVGCLWLYYFTPQVVENVIADLLAEVGILNLSERFLWLNNPNLCIPTGKEIDRVWFDSGTSYIRALDMLTETVLYRFYINGNKEPCFKPAPPELSETIKRIDDKEYLIRKTEERLDELYNHFIINGEIREMRRNWLSVMAYPSVYDLTETSGMFRGATTDDGGNLIIKRGFIWKTGEEAEQSWNEAGADLGIGYFEHIVTELTPGTDYKFQSFAEDDKGNKRYSAWYYFKTEEGIS